MRRNYPVTNREQQYPEGEQLISTTTPRGVITAVNEAFCRISGFEQEELVGQAHNIVRHPDMPQSVFGVLWEDLKQGRSWLGLVKNRCRNGDHYYVDAYVMPMHEGEQLVGFQSVRTRPDPAAVTRAERCYRELRTGRRRLWSRRLPAQWPVWVQAWLAAAPVTLAGLGAAFAGASAPWVALTAGLAAGLTGLWLTAALRRLAAATRAIVDDPIGRYIYAGRTDEVGQLGHVLHWQRMQERTIIGRVGHAADAVADIARRTDEVVAHTTGGVRQQQLEVEQVATAMNEMTATVAEVARHAEETARASQQVLAQTAEGSGQIDSAVGDIENLSRVVAEASEVMERLRAESDQIGSVVDVISNIASETNLLALNAAIEAARAGEHGRGFAVVADEVRNLASHTQQSTAEIQQMIKAIQESSELAVEAMRVGQTHAQTGVEVTRAVGETFEAISGAVDHIATMNAQVATAADQQSQVSEEINRSLTGITSLAAETLEHADVTADSSRQLSDQVGRMQSLVRQFGRD